MIENKLFLHLSTSTSVTAIAAARIYPVLLPQDPTLPAITYQRVAGNRENDLSQGYVGLENIIVQIDAWATSWNQARSLSSAVITAACASTTFKALALNSPIDIYEDDIKIYRRTCDLSIWNHE